MTNTELAARIIQDSLRNTGLIANYRHLEGRATLQAAGSPVPDLAPKGVNGGCSTQLAMRALEIAALGSESTAASWGGPRLLPPCTTSWGLRFAFAD